MEEEPSDELMGLDRHGLLPIAVGVIPPAEGDLAILECEDAVIADGDPVGVSAEVLEDPFGAVKGRLAVDDPFLVVKLSPEDLKDARIFEMCDTPVEDKVFIVKALLEMVKELAPEQRRHHSDGDEETLAA